MRTGRNAEGMVEGTSTRWLGADREGSASEVGEVADGRSTAGSPEAQPLSRFQGTANETVGARQWRSNDCKELSLRWEKAIRCPPRCRQPFAVHVVQGSPGERESRGL